MKNLALTLLIITALSAKAHAANNAQDAAIPLSGQTDLNAAPSLFAYAALREPQADGLTRAIASLRNGTTRGGGALRGNVTISVCPTDAEDGRVLFSLVPDREHAPDPFPLSWHATNVETEIGQLAEALAANTTITHFYFENMGVPGNIAALREAAENNSHIIESTFPQMAGEELAAETATAGGGAAAVED